MEVVLCINHLFLAITRQKLLLLERAGEAIVVVALPTVKEEWRASIQVVLSARVTVHRQDI